MICILYRATDLVDRDGSEVDYTTWAWHSSAFGKLGKHLRGPVDQSSSLIDLTMGREGGWSRISNESRRIRGCHVTHVVWLLQNRLDIQQHYFAALQLQPKPHALSGMCLSRIPPGSHYYPRRRFFQQWTNLQSPVINLFVCCWRAAAIPGNFSSPHDDGKLRDRSH